MFCCIFNSKSLRKILYNVSLVSTNFGSKLRKIWEPETQTPFSYKREKQTNGSEIIFYFTFKFMLWSMWSAFKQRSTTKLEIPQNIKTSMYSSSLMHACIVKNEFEANGFINQLVYKPGSTGRPSTMVHKNLLYILY